MHADQPDAAHTDSRARSQRETADWLAAAMRTTEAAWNKTQGHRERAAVAMRQHPVLSGIAVSAVLLALLRGRGTVRRPASTTNVNKERLKKSW